MNVNEAMFFPKQKCLHIMIARSQRVKWRIDEDIALMRSINRMRSAATCYKVGDDIAL